MTEGRSRLPTKGQILFIPTNGFVQLPTGSSRVMYSLLGYTKSKLNNNL